VLVEVRTQRTITLLTVTAGMAHGMRMGTGRQLT